MPREPPPPPNRREALATIAAAALAGPLNAQSARHVHDTAAQAKAATGGVYKPRTLTGAEYKTLETLCELTVPGASKGNAAEFIDTLCTGSRQMTAIYTAGLAWLNAEMQRRYEADFQAATIEQRTALLTLIAYRQNASPALNPGIEFFDWVRRMTLDAYFTSKAGIAELGFKGNGAMAEYQVPLASLNYVKGRTNLL